MSLRDKNFVGSILDISDISVKIMGLEAANRYYFYANISGRNRVFYVELKDYDDGVEIIFAKDNSTYVSDEIKQKMYHERYKKDERIKIFTSTENHTPIDNSLVVKSSDPLTSMANFVEVYLEAIQTINNGELI